MLRLLIGEVDLYSASVLVAMSLGAAIFCTTWIAQRRSRAEIDNDFDLAKIRQADSTKLELAKIVDRRDVEMKKIESGMITSHRSDDRGD